jgi:outer membrane protein assembly factor BamB
MGARIRAALTIGAVTAAVLGLAGVVDLTDAATGAGANTSGWTVYHGDAAGDGAVGGVASVDTNAPAWTSPALDGQLYGEPLVSGGRIFVATENNTVYALTAATGAVAWSVHLGTAVPANQLPCGDITPAVGITGTPVIDPGRSELFVVADEMVGGAPVHELVGLATTTGQTELTQHVDPPGSTPSALLQRTGLTLDTGRVVFGYGGNFGDCGSYHGWVVSVPEAGGAAADFAVDSGHGQSQGAIWMGGAAPVVDGGGHIWVEAGNGSVHSARLPYDDSDSVLELSPSLSLLQYFAPTTWASDNATDLDLSTAPALLANGQVVAAGKAQIAYLLNGAALGGIGGQQALLSTGCGNDISGGDAFAGVTVYLPCLSGVLAVEATSTPTGLRVLWRSSAGGGPPIIAAGLVWTVGQNGTLYGLNPATGRPQVQEAVGAPANHFPTPSVGAGLLLVPTSDRVVAFRAPAAVSPTSTTTATTTTTRSTTTPPHTTSTTHAEAAPDHPGSSSGSDAGVIAAAVVGGLALAGLATYLGLRARRRRGLRP